jgi:hypothetical protein
MVESAQWDAVILKDAKGRIEIDLRDVFTVAQVEQGRAALATAKSPADLLNLPFAKLL